MVRAETSAQPGAAADAVTPQSVTLSGLASPEQDLSSLTAQSGTVRDDLRVVSLPEAAERARSDLHGDQGARRPLRLSRVLLGLPRRQPGGRHAEHRSARRRPGRRRRHGHRRGAARARQLLHARDAFSGSSCSRCTPGRTRCRNGRRTAITDTSLRNIISYTHQIGERTPDRRLLPYNYGVSQIAHEMGHRWSAFVSARIGTETIPLGPTHWARGLHAPVAFPYPAAERSLGDGRRRVAGQLRRHLHAARRRLLRAGDRLVVPRPVSDGVDQRVRGAGLLHPAQPRRRRQRRAAAVRSSKPTAPR